MLYDIAQYALIVMLTFCFSYLIIGYNSKIRAGGIKVVFKSQSVIHNKTKAFMDNTFSSIKNSQSKNHIQNHILRVMVVDGKAYWIKDNIFFVSEVDNGNVLHESAKQVDTTNMSKSDLDKMMFILDKLNGIK